MTNKDEASPRQRVLMEQRWAGVRKRCAEHSCDPDHRMHTAGCKRRAGREALQAVKVTNLNTGVTSEATTVKEATDANEKHAVKLEPLLIPEELVFPKDTGYAFDQTYWDSFERGQNRELYRPRVMPNRDPDLVTYPGMEPYPQAPARPWWKFWRRRG